MKFIDAHIHLVNFLQETDGFNSLIDNMDKAGIEKAVVFGLPVKKKWQYYEPKKPHYYLDGYSRCYYFSRSDEIVAENYQKLSREQQQRFIPLLCAFDPTDLYAVDYISDMRRKYAFWKGIGELLLRHDDLSIMTADEQARVNHPGLAPVFKYCIEQDWPVLVLGSDLTGNFDSLSDTLHRYTPLMEQLPSEAADKIAWANAQRLWKVN